MEIKNQPTAGDSDQTTENGNTAVETDSVDEAKITRKELRKILREDSNWSLKSIAITALTGVSVAVISTQLTGLVSSMVLIAVMAFITASVSELYRIFIALTGLGAKKAAARVLPTQDAETKSDQHENIDSNTEAKSKSDPVTSAIEVVSNAYKLNKDQRSEDPGIFRRALYHFKNYTVANPFLLLIVLFLGIAISTVAATYIISDGEPPQIIEKTMVKQERLSNSDRSEIIQEAKNIALKELRSQIPDTSPTVSENTDSKELLLVQEKLAALELELKGVDRAVSTPEPTTYPTDNEDILVRLKELEKEKALLEDRIARLESELSEKSSPATKPVETSEPVETTPSETVPETKNQLQ